MLFIFYICTHTHRVALELCPGPENLNPYTRGFRCCTLIIIEEEFQFNVGKLTVEGCCDFKMQSRCRVCFVWLRCITTYFSADLCVHVEPAAVDMYSQSHVRVFAAVHYLLMCSHALPVLSAVLLLTQFYTLMECTWDVSGSWYYRC